MGDAEVGRWLDGTEAWRVNEQGESFEEHPVIQYASTMPKAPARHARTRDSVMSWRRRRPRAPALVLVRPVRPNPF